MMMINDTSITLENQTNHEPTTTTSTSISTSMWKLYENPFYNIHRSRKQFHHIHNHKLATSYWDVRFIGPVMGSELDRAKAKIVELKAELEFERKAMKKLENVNMKLAKELAEERQERENLERVCEELGKKILENKEEMSKMKREMGEERKMLRMAEVFREERVQMKLSEAKFLLQEKILELEQNKLIQDQPQIENSAPDSLKSGDFSREEVKFVSEDKLNCNCDKKAVFVNQRKPSPEPENPHIKRGIKGFVEFRKVTRAIGSRNGHLGTKFECQKTQLSSLLKQKSPMRSSTNLMLTS